MSPLKKYLERYDANVISVDWEPLARSPWYTSAAKNSRLVGKYTAEFIKFLVEEGGSTYDSFHVLGASLGAHAAGFVGHYSEVLYLDSGIEVLGPTFINFGFFPDHMNTQKRAPSNFAFQAC